MQGLLRELLLQLAVFAAYLAACEAISLSHSMAIQVAVPALALGVTLAACIVGGPSKAIGAMLAGFVWLPTIFPLPLAGSLAAAQAGICATVAHILDRHRFRMALERPSDFASLLAVIIPLVAIADTLAACGLMAIIGPGNPNPSASSVLVELAWGASARALGATLVAPVALLARSLAWPTVRQLGQSWRRSIEFLLLVACVAAAAIVLPAMTDDGGLMWPVAMCLALPFAILLAVRFDRWGAIAVAAIVAGSLLSGVAVDPHRAALEPGAAQALAVTGLWAMTIATLATTMLLGITIAAHRKESAEVVDAASRLRHVVEAARLGFWQFDKDWRTLRVNARLASMLGFPEDVLLGKPLLELVSERTRTEAGRHLAAVERGEREEFELECRRGDGRVAWLGLHVTRSRGGVAAPGAIAAVEDLAERRRAEAERLRLETSMLHAQKLESLGVLAGGLAHDFNNIVMGIRGNAGLLRVRSGASQETQACADRIDSLCQRAAELVSTLLAYAGKGDFVMERLPLVRVVREAIAVSRLVAPPNVRLELDAEDESLEVTADPHHLRQLCVGILGNALESLGPGGGTVRTRCRRATPGGVPSAEVEIVDDGCGMGDATLARMFEPFFSTKGLGRGLGMSAALGIARRLGGNIEVESRVGVGTTVRVRVPLASNAAVAERGANVLPPRRPTAIVAEPDSSLRELVVAALEIRGFAVSLERDMQSALATCEDRPPGALVAYAGSSILGALDLVRAARARGMEVPVILTTDQRDSTIIDAGDRHTIWLARPFDVRRLLDALDRATGVRPVARIASARDVA